MSIILFGPEVGFVTGTGLPEAKAGEGLGAPTEPEEPAEPKADPVGGAIGGGAGLFKSTMASMVSKAPMRIHMSDMFFPFLFALR
jgi:hypothetical protein